MRRLVLAALLLAAIPAAAQPMAGGAVPPPRQRSGIPIGDQNLPAGTLTVRVVHDDEKAYVDPGTPVHLVGVRARGGPTLKTARTDAQGRVEFSGLDHDGATTYYALVVIGDDRLESQIVTLPPQVGMKMIFSARKRGPDGKPVGEVIDDQTRDREVPEVPAGEVWIALQGRFEGSDVQVHLRRLGDAAIPAKSAVATGEKERREARFTGVPGGPESVYLAEVVAGTRTYRSLPFMLTPAAGASRAILVYDKPLVALQGGATMDDERIGFEIGVNLVNLMGSPYDAGEEGLVVPLPDGFYGASVSDDNNPLGDKAKIVPGEGLVITGVLPPGQTTVVVGFALPVEGGRARFSMSAPYGLYESRIFIERGDQMIITSAKLAAPEVVTLEGREYYQVLATVPPADKLDFDILGLPQRPGSDRALRILAGTLVLALLGWALLVTMRGPRAPAGKPRDARRIALEHDKERLYDDLVGLEKKRKKGDLDDEAYEDARRSLVAKLVLVHRELDELSVNPQS